MDHDSGHVVSQSSPLPLWGLAVAPHASRQVLLCVDTYPITRAHDLLLDGGGTRNRGRQRGEAMGGISEGIESEVAKVTDPVGACIVLQTNQRRIPLCFDMSGLRRTAIAPQKYLRTRGSSPARKYQHMVEKELFMSPLQYLADTRMRAGDPSLPRTTCPSSFKRCLHASSSTSSASALVAEFPPLAACTCAHSSVTTAHHFLHTAFQAHNINITGASHHQARMYLAAQPRPAPGVCRRHDRGHPIPKQGATQCCPAIQPPRVRASAVRSRIGSPPRSLRCCGCSLSTSCALR